MPAAGAPAASVAGESRLSAHTRSRSMGRRALCAGDKRVLRVPYHNKADGFTAALVLALNQVKYCERHGCRPVVDWGPFPACKYAGVRFPGRTPFFDPAVGANAFEYYFRPVCAGAAAAAPLPRAAPTLTCEEREAIHRQEEWAVRTYYYGATDPRPPPGRNESDLYDDGWYSRRPLSGSRRRRGRMLNTFDGRGWP